MLRTTVGFDTDRPSYDAVTATASSTATIAAGKISVLPAAPAGIVTDDGSVKRPDGAAARLTTMPPLGAIPLRRTVNLPSPPARITVCSDKLLRYGSLTMTSALLETKALVAVMVTRVVVLVADVRALTVVVEAPPGTTIVGGAATRELLDDNNTSWPPDGAGPVRVTRIVIDRPPVTLPDAVNRSN